MELAAAIVVKIAECFVSPIVRKYIYLRNYDRHFEELHRQVDNLKNAKDRVRFRADAALKNEEVIDEYVRQWLVEVESIIYEVEKFIEGERHRGYFKGLCPNLMIRYKSSKAAVREVDLILRQLDEGRFESVSYSIVPTEFLLKPRDSAAWESRSLILNNILTALKDDSIHRVGIYGMAGIGKTTLAEEVVRQVKKHKFFDDVVMVSITVTPNLEKIQQAIAAMLRIEFDKETERTSRLYAQLKNGKILVILDDIWGHLDLKKIGIPSGDDHGECKLLLTTRNRKVLDEMGAKPFHIGNLYEEEAWRLFKAMTGDEIEQRRLKDLAMEVVKECKGLPLAIVTLGKSLRNKHKLDWEHCLQELRSPYSMDLKAVLSQAYEQIEISYDYLQHNELKTTFLLCSLMENDASVSNLLKYVMGLNILQGDFPKMKGTRERLKKLVSELKDSCLVLDGRTSEHFSMHNVVRKVAISKADRDLLVLKEWPDKDHIEKCRYLSLIDTTSSEPPPELKFLELEFFYMRTENTSFEIHDNFFMRMPKLKVLSLIRMGLKLSSWSVHLPHIQTLCLDFCKLEGVEFIGELKELKILSLQGSNITQLPKQIGQLTQLRLLDLSDSNHLKVISPKVISSLSQLEELYMINCPVQWDVEGTASVKELKHLSCLTTLEVNIRDVTILPNGFFSAKMERYKIFIGDSWDADRDKNGNSRLLKLDLNSSTWPKELRNIKEVEVLYLKWKGFKSVPFELGKGGFLRLDHLHIVDSENCLSIVDDSQEFVNSYPLSILESLFLSNLKNLQKICRDRFTIETFCKLKSIEVKECHQLKNIFSVSTLRDLQKLETITVSSCQNMVEIFAIVGEDGVRKNEPKISQICSLTLSNLRQLTRLYSRKSKNPQTKSTSKASTEINTENEVDSPPSLFDEKVSSWLLC